MELKHALERYGTLSAALENEETLQHAITLDPLIPDPKFSPEEPVEIDPTLWAQKDLYKLFPEYQGTRIKAFFMDMTPEEARARGYVTGELKEEQVLALTQRETFSQTIYKKQGIHRDELTDISFDVVGFMWKEMRDNLELLKSKACIQDMSASGVDPTKIRPIIDEPAPFTHQRTVSATAGTADRLVGYTEAISDIKVSGMKVAIITKKLMDDFHLLTRATDEKWMFNKPMTVAQLAAILGVGKIVIWDEVNGLGGEQKAMLTFVPSAYRLSHNTGPNQTGQVTTFEKFDIDYNKFKYLIEERLGFATVRFNSAVFVKEV